MISQLGLEDDGTFNWDKLSSLPEWTDHPMRQLMSALNVERAVGAWCENVAYMESQLTGQQVGGSSYEFYY